MKLIIDISEGDYAPFKFEKYIIVGGLRGNGKTLMSVMYKAIANATPLEKHDEEVIKETVESIWGKPPYDDYIRKQDVIDMWREISCNDRCHYREKCSETYCDFKLFENKVKGMKSEKE